MSCHCLRRIVAVAAFVVASGAYAAPITKRPIDGNGVADTAAIIRLISSFEVHARAARAWYMDARERYERVATADFALFEQPMARATFVSFTYVYIMNGERRTRVYHARSGHNEPWKKDRTLKVRRSYQSFFPHDAAAVVAWDSALPTRSRVTPSPVKKDKFADQRKRDAELKVARMISQEIREGLIAAGGYLYGYSSQEPCDSCEAALTALSDGHDIHVTVTYLTRQSRAYLTFDRLRHQYLNSIHVAANGGQLNLLSEEAATGGAAPLAVACADEPEDGEVDD